MISIVIVTYNSENFIKKCIDSIYSQTKDEEFEIIVVDNNSKDRTVRIIYNKYKNVRLIRNKYNKGFAAANNIAIKRAKGEYIFFLNPDTVLKNNVVKYLKDFLKNNKEAGVVGGKLIYFDGTQQLSCRKFPNFINVFFGRKSILRIMFPKNPITRKYMLTDLDYNKKQKVDWIMGAALMAKKDLLQKINYFDEDYFLFVEDTDLCYKMNKLGYKIYYIPDAIIYHYHGGSVEHKFNISQMHHNFGMYKFFKKHYIKNPISGFFLYLSILVRLISVFMIDNVLNIISKMNKNVLKRFS